VARAAPIPPALADPAARGADLAAIARVLESRLVAARSRPSWLDWTTSSYIEWPSPSRREGWAVMTSRR
jgi:hypothetical protein